MRKQSCGTFVRVTPEDEAKELLSQVGRHCRNEIGRHLKRA